MYLSLIGKARESVRGLKAADLNSDDSLEKLFEKLDGVFLKDKTTRACDKFQKFYNCDRTTDETADNFVVKFEQLYCDLAEFDMALPDGVKAFFPLNASNLPDAEEKLARATTTELTYANMKEQIKKICGTTGGEQSTHPVKEDVFYANSRYSKGYANRKKEQQNRSDRFFRSSEGRRDQDRSINRKGKRQPGKHRWCTVLLL